jgi:hypothetical protein
MSGQLAERPNDMPAGLSPSGEFIFINTFRVNVEELRPGDVVLVPSAVVGAGEESSWFDFCSVALFVAMVVRGVAHGTTTLAFLKKIGNGALPAGWPAADAIGTVVSFLNAPYFIKANETLVSFVPDLTAAARLYSGVCHPSSSDVRNIVFTSKSAKKNDGDGGHGEGNDISCISDRLRA